MIRPKTINLKLQIRNTICFPCKCKELHRSNNLGKQYLHKESICILCIEIQTMKCAYQTHLADWNGYPHLRNKSASNEQAAAMCYTSIPFELLPLFLPLLLQIAISNPFFSRNQDHLAHKGKFVNLSYMYIILCSTSFVVGRVCLEKSSFTLQSSCP